MREGVVGSSKKVAKNPPLVTQHSSLVTPSQDGAPLPKWKTEPKVPKTEEDWKQIRYLDELRATARPDSSAFPLATVVEVRSLSDIPRAGERYALAQVFDGTREWTMCVRRDLVKVGDRALFVTDDALLPDEPRYLDKERFSTMRKIFRDANRAKHPHYVPHVKRHIYRANPGELIPLDVVPELAKVALGEDASLVLNIDSAKHFAERRERETEANRVKAKAEKHARALAEVARQKAAAAARKLYEKFEAECPQPDFLKRTQLPEIDECPELFEQYTDCPFEVTEKVLGMPMFVYCTASTDPKSPVCICTQGQKVRYDPAGYYWRLIRRSGLERALRSCGHDLVVQGLATGRDMRPGLLRGAIDDEFQLFDIFDIEEQRTLLPVERRYFCKEFRVPHVPIVQTGFRVFARYRALPELRAFAIGRNANGKPRRGLVFRSETPALPVWFQVANPQYGGK